MGNLFSQETDNVIVKIKPYFFTINEDGYSQDKIKNFNITKMINLKKNDKDYLFNIWKYNIKKSSFKKNQLIFNIKYDKDLNTNEIENYISNAWTNFCNSGDPIKASFIKEKKYNKKQIYFSVSNIDFEYPNL